MSECICDMPFCECPHCGAKWQEDEFYLNTDGDVLTCPTCERDIHILWEEATMTRCLGTESAEGKE